jgi:hypothetical protein
MDSDHALANSNSTALVSRRLVDITIRVVSSNLVTRNRLEARVDRSKFNVRQSELVCASCLYTG